MKILSSYKISKFNGLLTEISDLKSIPDGYSPDALNFITSNEKDAIILRRGTKRLGATEVEGAGKITGLGVGTRFDGTQIPFFSYGRKVKYYDSVTDDVIEVGTDMLPVAANGDEVSISPYQNIAGAFIYLSSINSSIYKIPVANPGSAVDQSSTTYRGFLKFGQARGFLFNRNGATAGNKDQVGLYASYIDKVALSQYPAQTTGEAVGALGATHYTHTLTNITGKRTAMFVQVEATVAAGTEIFVDDKNGNLVSNFGGTGTINYATGAVVVDFSAITTGAVTCSYYYEDASNKGVIDFSIASPAARIAGEGNYFPQFDGGGKLNSIFLLATVFYCFHELKTWQVSIPSDDVSGGAGIPTNLPFREKLGVKSKYGAYGGEKGIYLINTAGENKPEFYRLELYAGATSNNIAYPKLLSDLISFEDYSFDNAVVFEWGDYVLIACQQIRNGVADAYNSRMFLYNKKTGVFDLTDYPASVLAEYMGTLLAGDPITNNVYTLFSGFDDDNEVIPNYWTSGQSNLTMEGQKRFTRMVFEGLIQTSQKVKVQLSFDGGDFVDAFVIDGNGSYVDKGKSIAVGANTIGSKVAGGGATVFAHPFQVEFKVQSPKFEYVRMKIVACSKLDENDADEQIGGGYFELNSYEYKDIRQKSLRVVPSRNG